MMIFFLFCFFPYVTVSLVAVHHWDIKEEKEYFFQCKLFVLIPMEQLELVGNPILPGRLPGRVVQASLDPCFHLDHCHFLLFCSHKPGGTSLPTVSPKSSNKITAHSYSLFNINKEIFKE